MAQKIIVVGLSAASIAFITKLRTFDTQSELICFSAESKFPYNRCLVADFLTQEVDELKIQLKPESFFQQPNTTFYFDTCVTRLDVQAQQVFVGDKVFEYDYLFLGIGTAPYVPAAFQGKNSNGIFTFHTLSDMKNIQQYIQAQKPQVAIVVGAGINGIEAASSLQQIGLAVIVVEMHQQILSTQVNQTVAAWIQQKVVLRGVSVITGHGATGVLHDQDAVCGIELNSGSKIYADMIVLAAGSKLNSQLLANTGIELTPQGSIKVDQHLKTNIGNVFAAGDICAALDIVSHQMVRSATWSDAMLQGLCAATNFSLQPRVYNGIVGLRDSFFFGYYFYACGSTIGAANHEIEKKLLDNAVEFVYLDQGVVQGFVLIGDLSRLSDLKKSYIIQSKIES